MKKIFVLLVLAFVLFSCDNGDVETEPNPYPDGVYPFEVSNITHTKENTDWGGVDKYVFTWDNPTDKDFSRVECKAFWLMGGGEESLMPAWDDTQWSFTLEKNRLTITTFMGAITQHLIVKCVDRFGNVSAGVRYNYEFSPYYPLP